MSLPPDTQTIEATDLLDLARAYWREAHEWICWGRHGGTCAANGHEGECEYPPDDLIADANRRWLEESDDGFNYLEYGRWDREERIPAWPRSPGSRPRYRK